MKNICHSLFKISFLTILCWPTIATPSSEKNSKIQQESKHSSQEEKLFDQLTTLVTQEAKILVKLKEVGDKVSCPIKKLDSIEKMLLDLRTINKNQKALIKVCKNTFSSDTWQSTEPDFQQLLQGGKTYRQALRVLRKKRCAYDLMGILEEEEIDCC